ncbi:MAG: hypothetical protein RIR55_303 [Bacteroidota bacterium]|jgi:hypothetical protein
MNKNISKILVSFAIGIIVGITLGYIKQKFGFIRSGDAEYGIEGYYFNSELATTSGLATFSICIVLFFLPSIFKK